MDVQKIKEDFKKVISYTQGIEDPKVDRLFEQWYAAKKEFIDAFGGEPIYELPEEVSFFLDDKAKESKVSSLIDYIWDTNPDLSDFIYANKDNFFENKTIREYNSPTGIIPANMKLIKAFKFFESDKKLLHQIQDRASLIIQENKIKGKLCFSVHPLDFLSSSLNTYNWRSCHALDGEYRSGNLSYMIDNVTVMCYLKGEDNVCIPMFPDDVKWNNKKWRMLTYISEDREKIFCGRPYPFATEHGFELCVHGLKMVLKIIDKFSYDTKLRNLIVESVKDPKSNYNLWLKNKYIYQKCCLVPIESVIQDSPNSLHFNDVLYSTCYKPYYYINAADYEQKEDKIIWVGNEVACLQCGNELIADSSTMRCPDCELKYGTETKYGYGYCECCGCRIRLEDSHYVNVGYEEVYVCEHCFDIETATCAHCKETFFRNDMFYDREISEYICQECKEEKANGTWK